MSFWIEKRISQSLRRGSRSSAFPVKEGGSASLRRGGLQDTSFSLSAHF
jgi:hypothetical protein